MGRYKLSKTNVTNCPPLSNVPVYKKDGGKFYLYLTHRGNWIVSDVVGHIGYFLDEDNPADLVQNFFLLGSQYLYPVSQRPWIVFTFLFAKLSSSQQFS